VILRSFFTTRASTLQGFAPTADFIMRKIRCPNPLGGYRRNAPAERARDTCRRRRTTWWRRFVSRGNVAAAVPGELADLGLDANPDIVRLVGTPSITNIAIRRPQIEPSDKLVAQSIVAGSWRPD
jgi:hypothetical protein